MKKFFAVIIGLLVIWVGIFDALCGGVWILVSFKSQDTFTIISLIIGAVLIFIWFFMIKAWYMNIVEKDKKKSDGNPHNEKH